MKQILIFLCAVCVCLALLFAGDQLLRLDRERAMLAAAEAGRRADGAANLAVMDGVSGYLGASGVYLQYGKDGSITVCGVNETDESQWKQLSQTELEPGTYTLAGLRGSDPGTLELRLKATYPDGREECYWQYDEDVAFTLNEACQVELHVRVLPCMQVDAIAHPAIYREKENG